MCVCVYIYIFIYGHSGQNQVFSTIIAITGTCIFQFSLYCNSCNIFHYIIVPVIPVISYCHC